MFGKMLSGLDHKAHDGLLEGEVAHRLPVNRRRKLVLRNRRTVQAAPQQQEERIDTVNFLTH